MNLCVVFPSVGWSSLLPIPFLFGWYRWVPFGDEWCPAAALVFGNHSCFFSKYIPALSDSTPHDPICCRQVVYLVGCSHYMPDPRVQLNSPRGTSSQEVLLSASWLLSSCSLRSRGVGLSRVVLWLAAGVVGLVVDDCVDVRGVCGCGTCFLIFLFVCMIILIIRRSVIWSFSLFSSIIVHVPEVWRRDGVTVASKSLSLPLSGVCW